MQEAADIKAEGIDEHLETIKKEAFEKYNVDNTKDLPINYNALSMQSDEEFADKIHDEHYAELYAKQRNQNHVYRAFSAIWPLIPARFQSMAFARTDMSAHHHFNVEVEVYRRDFVKRLNDDMMLNSRTGDWGYQSPEDAWEALDDASREKLDFEAMMRVCRETRETYRDRVAVS